VRRIVQSYAALEYASFIFNRNTRYPVTYGYNVNRFKQIYEYASEYINMQENIIVRELFDNGEIHRHLNVSSTAVSTDSDN